MDLDEVDSTVSHAQETAFLKQEVGRLAAGLYGGAGDSQSHSLAHKLRKFAYS